MYLPLILPLIVPRQLMAMTVLEGGENCGFAGTQMLRPITSCSMVQMFYN
jgi:hypothetical protein